jgi:hypothetical protein
MLHNVPILQNQTIIGPCAGVVNNIATSVARPLAVPPDAAACAFAVMSSPR